MTDSLTATVQSANGRVLLQLTWAAATTATIHRIHADGSTWVLRDANPVAISGTAIVYDNELPLDQAVSYLATSTDTSATLASTPVTLAADPGMVGSMIWLTHPTKPSLSMLLTVAGFAPQTRAGRNGILQIIGSPQPVGISDVRVPTTGSLTAWTGTTADTQALRALLADGSPLLIRPPGSWSTPWQYVMFGDVTDVAATVGPVADQDWVMPYTVVAPPTGPSQGAVGATWNDVTAAYATWTAEIAGEATWTALTIHAGP